MKTPTIHLNGTGKDALMEQVMGAGSALQAALRAMEEAAPNGRDYYPQGPGALTEAAREHEERVKAVRTVMSQYEKMAETIVDA